MVASSPLSPIYSSTGSSPSISQTISKTKLSPLHFSPVFSSPLMVLPKALASTGTSGFKMSKTVFSPLWVNQTGWPPIWSFCCPSPSPVSSNPKTNPWLLGIGYWLLISISVFCSPNPNLASLPLSFPLGSTFFSIFLKTNPKILNC